MTWDAHVGAMRKWWGRDIPVCTYSAHDSGVCMSSHPSPQAPSLLTASHLHQLFSPKESGRSEDQPEGWGHTLGSTPAKCKERRTETSPDSRLGSLPCLSHFPTVPFLCSPSQVTQLLRLKESQWQERSGRGGGQSAEGWERQAGSERLGCCDLAFSSWAERGLQGASVVVHGLSCSAACGIFLDQGSNPCPPHWQEASNHQTTREVQLYYPLY